MPAPEGASVRVVPIAEADIGAVAALVNRAFARYSDLFPGTRTSAADYVDEAGPGARVMLVEEDGRLVASSMVAAAEQFLAAELLGPAGTARVAADPHVEDGHPWLGALYYGLAGVEPGIMNHGLGRLMVSHTETMAREEGFARVALGTVREVGLVDYYSRLGYRVIHEEAHPVGHWEFVVPHHYCEMVKDL